MHVISAQILLRSGYGIDTLSELFLQFLHLIYSYEGNSLDLIQADIFFSC